MDTETAVDTLASLAQSTRLEIFRLLASHEPDGLAAGAIAASLGVPHNTLSTHLAILHRAGLIVSTRLGRSIVYRVHLESLRGIVLYLLRDCCGGRPEICAPLITELTPCHPAKETIDG